MFITLRRKGGPVWKAIWSSKITGSPPYPNFLPKDWRWSWGIGETPWAAICVLWHMNHLLCEEHGHVPSLHPIHLKFYQTDAECERCFSVIWREEFSLLLWLTGKWKWYINYTRCPICTKPVKLGEWHWGCIDRHELCSITR